MNIKCCLGFFAMVVSPSLLAMEATPDLEMTTTKVVPSETAYFPLRFQFGKGLSTRLGGNILLAPATAEGGNPPGKGETKPILGHLIQVQLASSLTGWTGLKDVLRMGMVTGKFGEEHGFANQNALNTHMALLAYQYDETELSTLEYRFALLEDRIVLTFKPIGFSLSSVLMPNSAYRSLSDGALSRFAGASPIYKLGSLTKGIGVDFLQNDWMQLQLAYGERDANHRALGLQYLLTLGAERKIVTGLTYVRAFSQDAHLDTFTGSYHADTSGGLDKPATIHALNGSIRWFLTPRLELGGWLGLVLTDARGSEERALSSTFLVSLGLSHLLTENDALVVMSGQPLRLIQGHGVEEDEAVGMHYEAFYRLTINKYLSLAPGCFLVTTPGYLAKNNNIFVAALRMTLSF